MSLFTPCKSVLKPLANYTLFHCRIIIKNILAAGEELLHLVAVFHAFPFTGLASFGSSILASFILKAFELEKTLRLSLATQ